MKCPTCNKEMEIKVTNISHNTNTGKQYTRTIYVCIQDDIWVTVEVPVETK